MTLVWNMDEYDDILMVAWVRRCCRGGEARRIREDARLKQTEVAQLLGVSAAAVNRWENALRMPRHEVAARYARLLEALIENGGRDQQSNDRAGQRPAWTHAWGPRDDRPWPPKPGEMGSTEYAAYRKTREFLREYAADLGWCTA